MNAEPETECVPQKRGRKSASRSRASRNVEHSDEEGKTAYAQAEFVEGDHMIEMRIHASEDNFGPSDADVDPDSDNEVN